MVFVAQLRMCWWKISQFCPKCQHLVASLVFRFKLQLDILHLNTHFFSLHFGTVFHFWTKKSGKAGGCSSTFYSLCLFLLFWKVLQLRSKLVTVGGLFHGSTHGWDGSSKVANWEKNLRKRLELWRVFRHTTQDFIIHTYIPGHLRAWKRNPSLCMHTHSVAGLVREIIRIMLTK